MLKILFKALILFLIVISVYLIVHPHACSNMLAGRVRTLPEEGVGVEWRHPMEESRQTITDSPKPAATSDEMFVADQTDEASTKSSTNTVSQPVYSQAVMDYAIASHYVMLEREYGAGKEIGKDEARKLSYAVMEDFELTPAEWEDFLARATASGLFEKVRKEQEAAAAHITTAADAVANATAPQKAPAK